MSVDVSVIVPVYNSEDFLKTCIDSIIEQSLKSIEIIFVDDGSTDNSLRIIDEYRAKDERIKIIQQKNLYAGVARNNGLSIATGKYVIFLDSDDVFKTNMIKDAFNVAEKHDAQIVMFGCTDYHMDTGTIDKKPFPKLPVGVFSPRDIGKDMYRVTSAVPWDKLILRSFLLENNIQFQSIRTGNDQFFSRAVVAKADRVYYIRKRYVKYRMNNPKSLQGNIRHGKSKKYSDVCLIISGLYEFLQSSGLMEETVKEAFIDWSSGLISRYCLMSSNSESELKELYLSLRRYLDSIPDDLKEAYQKEEIPDLIIHAETYESYLFRYLQYRVKEIEKSNAYKIGSRIIDGVPNGFKCFIQKSRQQFR